MKIAHNNKVNFNGAYIIKGSAKSVTRFENELNRLIAGKKHPDVLSMPLTDYYHENQPYMEILVCTASHADNLRTYLLKQTKQQEKKIKKFAEDFYSWDIEKREKWSANLQKAIDLVGENDKNITAPGEIALQNGNPDSFLDWYNLAIKKANDLYNKISGLGKLAFPAKIRRLDADKTFISLIDDNFNIKEGFIRNKPNKIDIEIVGNKEYRYKNNKFHEIITYKTDSLEENSIEATEKFYYDKNGNLKKIIKRNIFGEITNNKNK